MGLSNDLYGGKGGENRYEMNPKEVYWREWTATPGKIRETPEKEEK
jgi:hypothetical protein